ncbi:YopX family protein [Kaistella sp. 97-N-M2]|uniref:YopX family protein n=1 Tax=Kaistella sp. 97-N-M2 TaxID=2908645 RepID=UPI001F36B9E3|nr:YopX family protein [Kaistella sp. 97-N-M2]UJF29897.1 YopX family protein [Kaistella sp. 97-N-M2]
MAREIKFRIWDGSQMNYHVLAGKLGVFYASIDPKDTASVINTKYPENIEPMQFIGLKDKNGTEIYEGDKLQIKTSAGRTEVFTVVYDIHRRETKIGFTVDIPSFAFVNSEGFPTYPIVDNYLNGHDLEIIEVIGHIYQ